MLRKLNSSGGEEDAISMLLRAGGGATVASTGTGTGTGTRSARGERTQPTTDLCTTTGTTIRSTTCSKNSSLKRKSDDDDDVDSASSSDGVSGSASERKKQTNNSPKRTNSRRAASFAALSLMCEFLEWTLSQEIHGLVQDNIMSWKKTLPREDPNVELVNNVLETLRKCKKEKKTVGETKIMMIGVFTHSKISDSMKAFKERIEAAFEYARSRAYPPKASKTKTTHSAAKKKRKRKEGAAKESPKRKKEQKRPGLTKIPKIPKTAKNPEPSSAKMPASGDEKRLFLARSLIETENETSPALKKANEMLRKDEERVNQIDGNVEHAKKNFEKAKERLQNLEKEKAAAARQLSETKKHLAEEKKKSLGKLVEVLKAQMFAGNGVDENGMNAQMTA